MSNIAMQAEVSRLERDLGRIKAINRGLQGEVNTLVSGVMSSNSELNNFNEKMRNSLEKSSQNMVYSTSRVLAAYEMQGEIRRLYALYKNIETANKNIHACNNRWFYEFKNYRTVRKIVQGLMDNMDFNMVSDRAIARSVERQQLLQPDYWLTAVLISVMAWKSDDKPLADRAIARAMVLDSKYSSIFYMIFNLRMQRDEAARKWFIKYQDSDLTGGDRNTFLVLFSLISGQRGTPEEEQTKSVITEFLHQKMMQCMRQSGYSEQDTIDQLHNHFARLGAPLGGSYPLLRKYCSQHGQQQATLCSAQNNHAILEYILGVKDVSKDKRNEFLKQYIDELVGTPSQAEKSLRDEIAYNELVIKYKGEVEQAKETFEEQKNRDEGTLNPIQEIINWIYQPKEENLNGQMQLNMLSLAKKLHQQAVEQHIEAYHSCVRNTWEVDLRGYVAQMDFHNETGEQSRIQTFFIEKGQQEKAAIKNLPAYLLFAGALAAGVGAFFVGFWLFAATGAGAIAGVGLLAANAAKRRQIELENQAQSRNAQEVTSRLFEEYRGYEIEYAYYDNMAEQLLNEIETL